MGEGSSGKWYTSDAVIASIIGAVLVVILPDIINFIKKKDDTTVSSPSPIQSEPHAQVKEIPVKNRAESMAVFQDDFEEGLGKWRVKRYPGYNNFMRWHISGKEHVSGRNSLALGHEDTDTKENTDTVHIETEEELFLGKEAVLLFKLRKSYRINLEIVLKKNDAAFKETVIGFYPGNTPYKDWRAEEIPLGSEIDAGKYTLLFRAWDQGRLYLDDIKIQNREDTL